MVLGLHGVSAQKWVCPILNLVKMVFSLEIGRIRVCKDFGLNVIEFIGGMGVPGGLPVGKRKCKKR